MPRISISIVSPLAGAWLASCAVAPPEGRFACATAKDCPSGWVCAADRRCWSAPIDGGASRLDAGDGSADTFVACPEGALACGDFEDGAGDWVITETEGASGEIVESPVRVGRGALRLTTGAAEGAAVHASIPLDAIDAGTLYGRALVWVSEATELPDAIVAMQLDDGDSGGPDKISLDMLPEDRLALTVTTTTPGIDGRSAALAVRRDDWMCVRFRVELSETAGSAHADEAGRAFAQLEDIRTLPASGAFRRFSLLIWSATGGSRELVFDAVALDDAPLDCP